MNMICTMAGKAWMMDGMRHAQSLSIFIVLPQLAFVYFLLIIRSDNKYPKVTHAATIDPKYHIELYTAVIVARCCV